MKQVELTQLAQDKDQLQFGAGQEAKKQMIKWRAFYKTIEWLIKYLKTKDLKYNHKVIKGKNN